MAPQILDKRAEMPNYSTYKDWRRPSGEASIYGIAVHHTGPGSVDPNTGRVHTTPEAVFRYHVEDRGWAHGGYNYMIDRAGAIHYVLDERIPPYHAGLAEPTRALQPGLWQRWVELDRGQIFNNRYIAICMIGWFDTGRRTNQGAAIPDVDIAPSEAQWASLFELIADIRARFPQITPDRVLGHRELKAYANQNMPSPNFGGTECPGSQVDMPQLRRVVAGQAPRPTPTPPTPVPTPPAPTPRPTEPGPRLAVTPNRPLVGIHARNATSLTERDYQLFQQARIESVKTLSILNDEAYARMRQINPNMEFIVRLYKDMRGGVPSPQAFADEFQPLITRLNTNFGVLKFEIHNEPNHQDQFEGWGKELHHAQSFNTWYKQVFSIFKQRNPWGLFGFPGLAVHHNDLEWLEWCRESIELSDWLACHPYWQTPPHAPDTYLQPYWGELYKLYHEKYPHKLIEITEYGNSNGQNNISLSDEEMAHQYLIWLRNLMDDRYVGSAHSFIASSPSAEWAIFVWATDGGLKKVVGDVGNAQLLPRPPVPPPWLAAFRGFSTSSVVAPGSTLTLTGSIINGGRMPWRNGGPSPSTLVVRWLNASAQQVGEPLYQALPHDMAPSDEAAMRISVKAPSVQGSYTLSMDIYHTGFKRWIGALGGGSQPYQQQIQVGEVVPALRAEWLTVTVPEALRVGTQTPITVGVRNRGSRGWRAAGAAQGMIRLGYHWLKSDGSELEEGNGRGTLAADVPAGGETTITTLRIQPPTRPGSYILRLDLVSEGEAWFRQLGSQPRTVSVRVDPSLPALAYAYEQPPQLPREMVAATPVKATVTLRNTGSESWIARRADGSGVGITSFGYRWRTSDGQPVEGTWEDRRTPLPNDVPPGATVTLPTAMISPPAIPGNYRLDLGLVKEGVAWYPAPTPDPGSLQVSVTAPKIVDSRPPFAVAYGPHTIPPTLTTGQTVTVSVTLRNMGSQSWPAGGSSPVTLAHNWLQEGREANVLDEFRALLPNDVPPDGSVTLTAITLRAPTVPGTYLLQFELVQEQVAWFSARGNAPLQVAITVSQAATPVPEWAITWVEHRTPDSLPANTGNQRVDLRLRNSGRQPWPHSGPNPVRLGYHWFDANGQPVIAVADLRTALPKDIAPGEELAFAASLATPATPGTYRLEWGLVHEGLAWLKDRGAAVLSLPITLSAAPAAPGMRATASSNPTQSGLAVDGSLDTFWQSSEVQRPGMTFTVDLGREQVIDGVGYRSPGRGFPFAYTIAASRDGQRWHDVASLGYNWRDVAATFDAQPVRHLRITQTAAPRYQAPWIISEVEVRPAPAWTLTASHNPQATPQAFDRDPDTAWSSEAAQTPGMWLQVDIGQAKTIDMVTVRSPGRGYAAGYRLRLSPDGTSWTTVSERAAATTRGDIRALFNPVTTRFVRIELAGTDSGPWLVSDISLHENPTWRASASHNEAQALLAFDNREETSWTTATAQTKEMFFLLDMGQQEEVTGLVLNHGPRPEYPRGFLLQISPDGKKWETMFQVESNWAGVHLDFDKVFQGRFISIRQTTDNPWYPWTISELTIKRRRA